MGNPSSSYVVKKQGFKKKPPDKFLESDTATSVLIDASVFMHAINIKNKRFAFEIFCATPSSRNVTKLVNKYAGILKSKSSSALSRLGYDPNLKNVKLIWYFEGTLPLILRGYRQACECDKIKESF